MATSLTTANRRVLIGLFVAVAAVLATVVTLGLTDNLTFVYERVNGRAKAVVEDVPGPDTGPVCPIDKRYVDEKPEGLRPDVADAFRQLRAEAEQQGVQLCVNDGKRSRAQQQREFDEAVEKFGTEELAARYVLTPDKSMHVKGTAVDVQPLASASWIEDNGDTLGWCRRYENEPWHFEYHRDYKADGCPALEPSATGD